MIATKFDMVPYVNKFVFDCRKYGPSLILQSGHWWKALSNVKNKKISWHDILRWRNYVNANSIYLLNQSQRQRATPLPLPARCLVLLRQHHGRTAGSEDGGRGQSCLFAMFEGLCGGDPFQSQKVSQTNTITKRVLKGKLMRWLLDFETFHRIPFQLLSHQKTLGKKHLT